MKERRIVSPLFLSLEYSSNNTQKGGDYMNYGGSGTSKDDPIIVDTLQDLAPLMQKSAGSILHIAFPETYNGPKVIDLRSAGWNPDGRINIDWTTTEDQTIRRYVYFNGWTILGLSIMNSFFF